MDMVSSHSSFWKPVKIGLAVIAVLVLGYWFLSPGQPYEPPINGQYNSPANTHYEQAYQEDQNESYDGKSDAEKIGEDTGNAWNGLKESGKDFWTGLQSTSK